MNVCNIFLVLQTHLVITRKDHTCVYVILVTMVMGSHAMVSIYNTTTVPKNSRGEMKLSKFLLKFYYCFIDTNKYLKISPCHPNARSCHDLAMILLYYMS